MNAYCFRQHMKPNRVTFLFDVYAIQGDETPDEVLYHENDPTI